MKETIVITGGSGLLALNWAATMRDQFVVWLGMHNRTVTLRGVESFPLPVGSVDAILAAVEKLRPRLVIHTAGRTSIEDCEMNPSLAHHVNVELSQNVAMACSLMKVPLVHISTDHLFAGTVPYADESARVEPQNVYARTKAEAESRVLDACPEALVVRTNFYGWGPSYRRSFTDSIIGSLRQGTAITLFEDVFYTPILIETLASAVHDLVAGNASGIIHVVGDERISKYQFGLKVAEQFQLDSKLIKPGMLSDRKGLVRRPREMSLSNQKACRLLGRALGGVEEHLKTLTAQERRGLAEEIQHL